MISYNRETGNMIRVKATVPNTISAQLCDHPNETDDDWRDKLWRSTAARGSQSTNQL